jgi:ligand-binding sensor domain-containing protein
VRYCIVILLWLPFTNTCYAQYPEEKDFTLISVEQGLSHKQVNDIMQDRYGYLWIASRKGLNRYDGNSFQHFYSDSNSSSLPQDDIAKLKLLDKEQLAAITATGIHVINTTNMKTRNLIIPPGDLKYISKVNNATDLATDPSGNVFILTRSGFYKFNNQDKLVFRYDAYKKEEAENAFVFGNTIAIAGNGNFLLNTMPGLYLFETATNKLDFAFKSNSEFYKQVATEGERSRFFYSDDSSFTVFTGLKKELVHYNIRTKKRYSILLPFISLDKFDWRSRLFKLSDTLYTVSDKQSGFYLIKYDPVKDTFQFDPHLCFKDYFCSSFLLDHHGVLWIGTNKGIFKQNRSSIIEKMVIPFPRFNSSKKDLYITSIAVANNRIFAGGYEAGVMVFDQQTMAPLKQINLGAYWVSSNVIHNFLTINNDTLFVGTNGPLIWLNTKNYANGKVQLPNWANENWISSQFKDSRNNLYVCYTDSGSFYFRSNGKKEFTVSMHPEKNFQIVVPIGIAEDGEGNIWFAGHGMSRYNYRLGKFDLLLDSFPKIKVPRKEVTGAQFDSAGNMYFGLAGNGLIIYNPKQKKYQQLTRNDGLPDNKIYAVILIGDKLWIGTESGLANYDIKKKVISSFGMNDGMPADGFSAFSFYFDTTDKKLYCGFNSTIVRFDPNLLVKNTAPPLFFIENIAISGKGILHHPHNPISLPFKQNNFVLNLGVINFTDHYLQRFAYRFVKTGNEPWNDIGAQRNIIFSNLAPSNYRLQVKVFDKNNSWPEQIKEINIVIEPPFWQTLWFLVVIGLIVFSAIYYLQRRRINQIKHKANVDKLLAQTEMKALHAQMNPHFIFNCLNSIREMILNNENEQASHYLSKFARLIRITLNQSSKQFVSLADTVDYLERYIEMEKIRNSNFSHVIFVEQDLQTNEIMVPPMLIQPLIENAIWHADPHKKNLHINISFTKSGYNLVCRIEDDGIGIDESLKKKDMLPHEPSVGIENIKQRIKLLNEKYDLRSTVLIEDKSTLSTGSGSGTIVTLQLPIKTNETLWN